MSLLKEIENMAVDSAIPITDLLRKCLVLASELGIKELESWAKHELNGYQDENSIPQYRIIPVQNYANISSGYTNFNKVPFPIGRLPDELREQYEKQTFAMPITEIADMADSHKDERAIYLAWNPNHIYLLNAREEKIFNGELISVWKAFSKSSLLGILDTVRNRILEFIIQIKKENPDLDVTTEDRISSLNEEDKQRVTNIFNQTFYGGISQMMVASNNSTQIHDVVIKSGDMQELQKQLGQLGVEEEDINKLVKAINEDNKAGEKFGQKVRQWLKDKSASISDKVAVDSITQLLLQYFS